MGCGVWVGGGGGGGSLGSDPEGELLTTSVAAGSSRSMPDASHAAYATPNSAAMTKRITVHVG